jgi:two-component system chemotaxis sensor kinase CheA
VTDDADRIREEFFAESQEIVEALSRDLLLLDHGQKEGRTDPDLVNSVFRGVHTLKGVAGMFGYSELSESSHALEDLLDQVRLGRIALTQTALDVLFEGVEVLQRLLGAARGESHDVDLDGYARRIRNLLNSAVERDSDSLASLDLDPGVLSVLTEYEEHRLRTSVEQNIPLYQLRAKFALVSIDTELEALKHQVKSFAEIITYLPSTEPTDDDALELVILCASRRTLAQFRETLSSSAIVVDLVARRAGSVVPSTAPSRPSELFDAPSTRGSMFPGAQLAKDADVTPRTIAKTVRVDIEKLDHLMNVVGELGIVKSSVSRVIDTLTERPELKPLLAELHRAQRAFERNLASLQEGILDVRMVPLSQTFDRLGRAVRQASRERDKEVRLAVTGADTEVDKLIVEELVDPLLHIIRNAVDHGLETTESRQRIGKPLTGTIALNAYQKGNHVVIEIEDDGAGIDPNKVAARALERAILTEDEIADMTVEEIRQLIFLPGFSTAREVTDLSGRGVGMDVVRTNIGRLGGVVDVQSEVGVGTKFTLTLPITLAIVNALVLTVRGQVFAIPLSVVQEALFFDERGVRQVEGREVITLRGESLPIARVAQLFRLDSVPSFQGMSKASPNAITPPQARRESTKTRAGSTRGFVVVTALGQRRLGLVVDALEGQRDIITKPLGKSLSTVKGISGATDLGDQRVILVLDAPSILDEILAQDGGHHARLPS